MTEPPSAALVAAVTRRAAGAGRCTILAESAPPHLIAARGAAPRSRRPRGANAKLGGDRDPALVRAAVGGQRVRVALGVAVQDEARGEVAQDDGPEPRVLDQPLLEGPAVAGQRVDLPGCVAVEAAAGHDVDEVHRAVERGNHVPLLV